MNRRFGRILLSLGLSTACACALAQSPHPPAGTAPPIVSSAGGLDGETLYWTLIGEIALRQQEFGSAAQAFLLAAQHARAPELARRAAEIAAITRQNEMLNRALTLWRQVEPNAETIERFERMRVELDAQREKAVLAQLDEILRRHPEQLPNNLLGLNASLEELGDPEMARRIIELATTPYLEYPEAQLARAEAARRANDLLTARIAAEHALSLRPDWDLALALWAEILGELGETDTAIARLETYLREYPYARVVRFTLAKHLAVTPGREEESLRHLEILLANAPDDAQLLQAVALMAERTGHLDRAISALEHVISKGGDNADFLRLQLAQLYLTAKQPRRAESVLRQITHPALEDESKRLLAHALAKQGKTDAAFETLDQTRIVLDPTTEVLLKSRLLQDADRLEDARRWVDEAIAELGDEPDLLYEYAMILERLGRHESAEGYLRKLIALYPDHAHGLNALGYLLADANRDLDEAERLLTRALELAPNDPFILDSVGWLRYRQGRLEEALSLLQNAYRRQYDPEIAAHLIEVLTVLGRHEEAQALLKQATARSPDAEPLRRVQRWLEQRNR